MVKQFDRMCVCVCVCVCVCASGCLDNNFWTTFQVNIYTFWFNLTLPMSCLKVTLITNLSEQLTGWLTVAYQKPKNKIVKKSRPEFTTVRDSDCVTFLLAKTLHEWRVFLFESHSIYCITQLVMINLLQVNDDESDNSYVRVSAFVYINACFNYLMTRM